MAAARAGLRRCGAHLLFPVKHTMCCCVYFNAREKTRGHIGLIPALSVALHNRYHTIADMLNVSNLLFLTWRKDWCKPKTKTKTKQKKITPCYSINSRQNVTRLDKHLQLLCLYLWKRTIIWFPQLDAIPVYVKTYTILVPTNYDIRLKDVIPIGGNVTLI